MPRLIAEKSHLYGTRRLKAGDEYEASDQEARALVAVRMARYARKKPMSQRENAPAKAKPK